MGSQVDPQTMLNLLREQCTDIASKVNAMEMDKTEHTLVIQALEPLPKERKCFRMIGNVVVERTVGEVLPAVQKNRDQVRAVGLNPGSRRPHGPQCQSSFPPLSLTQMCAPYALFCVQISEMISKMTETLSAKQKEADEFQKTHKISSQSGGGRSTQQQEDEGGSQGVLI